MFDLPAFASWVLGSLACVCSQDEIQRLLHDRQALFQLSYAQPLCFYFLPRENKVVRQR